MKYPDATKEFAVSINPFFASSRRHYIHQTANTLKTFLPLFHDDVKTASTLLKYNFHDGIKSTETGYESAVELYREIFELLKHLTGSSLEEYSTLHPDFVTKHLIENFIENKGRGQKFFSNSKIEKNNKKLFVESFQWLTATAQQKYERAIDCTTKNVDINGHIYLITPSEQMIPTDITLNFINKSKITAPIHTDKKFVIFNKDCIK